MLVCLKRSCREILELLLQIMDLWTSLRNRIFALNDFAALNKVYSSQFLFQELGVHQKIFNILDHNTVVPETKRRNCKICIFTGGPSVSFLILVIISFVRLSILSYIILWFLCLTCKLDNKVKGTYYLLDMIFIIIFLPNLSLTEFSIKLNSPLFWSVSDVTLNIDLPLSAQLLGRPHLPLSTHSSRHPRIPSF